MYPTPTYLPGQLSRPLCKRWSPRLIIKANLVPLAATASWPQDPAFLPQRLGQGGPYLSRLILSLPAPMHQSSALQSTIPPFVEQTLKDYLANGGNGLILTCQPNMQHIQNLLYRIGYKPHQSYLMFHLSKPLGLDPCRTLQQQINKLLRQFDLESLDMIWLPHQPSLSHWQDSLDGCLRLHQQGKLHHWGWQQPTPVQQGYCQALQRFQPQHGFRAARWSMAQQLAGGSLEPSQVVLPPDLYQQEWWQHSQWITQVTPKQVTQDSKAINALHQQAQALSFHAPALLLACLLQHHPQAHLEIPLYHGLQLQAAIRQLADPPKISTNVCQEILEQTIDLLLTSPTCLAKKAQEKASEPL